MKNNDVKKERYEIGNPKIYVGNLIMGERYIEPQGKTLIENKWTGDSCVLEYKTRGGWLTTQTENIHAIEAIIKNSQGVEKYKLTGKYTGRIEATNLHTGQSWVVFEAPALPENGALMHNMNFFSLQLNLLSAELKAKIPPTDSRFREDVRAWEHADLEAS